MTKKLHLIQVEELADAFKDSTKGTLYSETIPNILNSINELPEEKLMEVSEFIDSKKKDK